MAANQYLTVHLPSQQEYNNVIVMGHEQGSCPILLPHPGLSPVPVVVGYQDQHLETDCPAQQPIVEIPGALVHGQPLYRTGDRFIPATTERYTQAISYGPRLFRLDHSAYGALALQPVSDPRRLGPQTPRRGISPGACFG